MSDTHSGQQTCKELDLPATKGFSGMEYKDEHSRQIQERSWSLLDHSPFWNIDRCTWDIIAYFRSWEVENRASLASAKFCGASHAPWSIMKGPCHPPFLPSLRMCLSSHLRAIFLCWVHLNATHAMISRVLSSWIWGQAEAFVNLSIVNLVNSNYPFPQQNLGEMYWT